MKKDIKRAYQIEKLYQRRRMNNEETPQLIDLLKECGYDSLGEYFMEKGPYEFSELQFEQEVCNPPSCLSSVFSAIETKTTKFLWMISDCTFIFNCTDTYNEKYCKENDIPVYNVGTRGGTIVSTPGDVSLCICIPQSVGVDANYILRRIGVILRRYEKDVIIDGNDILVGGKKVLGSVTLSMNDMNAWVAHVSFNNNSELISTICREPKTGKIPGYIRNLTPEKFILEVKRCLRCI